jgi:hypothetical protein
MKPASMLPLKAGLGTCPKNQAVVLSEPALIFNINIEEKGAISNKSAEKNNHSATYRSTK